jgi:hypothetical protein
MTTEIVKRTRNNPNVESIKAEIEVERIKLELEITENQLKREKLKRHHRRINFALSNHITHKNVPLDFFDHKYLLPVYMDDARDQTLGKPSQMGISEYALVILFEGLDAGNSVFYVLPKAGIRNMFVKTRVNATLEASPYYTNMMGKDKAGSVMVKKFKKADVAFVGAQKDTDMISFVADILIIDEFNFCNKQQLKHARKRLGHSGKKIEKNISTPTVKGVGVDVKLKTTDHKHWFQTCTHCGERQIIDFFKNIVHDDEGEMIGMSNIRNDVGVWCVKCGKEIDRLGDGEYVQKYQTNDKDVSGIQIPAFASPMKSVKEIWDEYRDARFNSYQLQLWYNNDIGLSYTAEGANLSLAVLDECTADYKLGDVTYGLGEIVTAGIDVGTFFHIRISKNIGDGDRQAMYIGKIRVQGGGKQELIELLKTFGVTAAVIDAAPERNLVAEIKEALEEVVWSCEYSSSDKTKNEMLLDDTTKVVSVNRTWSLDAMVAQVKRRKLYLPGDAPVVMNGEYYEQMMAPTRMLIKNEKGEERYVWEEGSQEDHMFHAENYDYIASKVAESMYGEPNMRSV